jgi:hypothetical protein
MTIDLGPDVRRELLSAISTYSRDVLGQESGRSGIGLQSGQWVTEAFVWRGWAEYSIPDCPQVSRLILAVDIQETDRALSITVDLGHDDGPELFYSADSIQIGPRAGIDVLKSVRGTLDQADLGNALRSDLDQMSLRCLDSVYREKPLRSRP